jgi:hypothetical protein
MFYKISYTVLTQHEGKDNYFTGSSSVDTLEEAIELVGDLKQLFDQNNRRCMRGTEAPIKPTEQILHDFKVESVYWDENISDCQPKPFSLLNQ